MEGFYAFAGAVFVGLIIGSFIPRHRRTHGATCVACGAVRVAHHKWRYQAQGHPRDLAICPRCFERGIADTKRKIDTL